jgi:hypothetical protein
MTIDEAIRYLEAEANNPPEGTFDYELIEAIRKSALDTHRLNKLQSDPTLQNGISGDVEGEKWINPNKRYFFNSLREAIDAE